LLKEVCPLCDGVLGWPEEEEVSQEEQLMRISSNGMESMQTLRENRKEVRSLNFASARYLEVRDTWPGEGRCILAQYTDQAILVYAAFADPIVAYAVRNQTFRGAEKKTDWDPQRMSWVKTNFLWMQYRSGWCTKPNQTSTVGLWIKRTLFEEILAISMGSCHYSRVMTKKEYDAHKKACKSDAGQRVTLQWDPDHTPGGGPVKMRRAVQLGLKGVWRSRVFDNSQGELLKVLDLTAFVNEQRQHTKREAWTELLVAQESVYPVPASISDHIGEGPLPDDER